MPFSAIFVFVFIIVIVYSHPEKAVTVYLTLKGSNSIFEKISPLGIRTSNLLVRKRACYHQTKKPLGFLKVENLALIQREELGYQNQGHAAMSYLDIPALHHRHIFPASRTSAVPRVAGKCRRPWSNRLAIICLCSLTVFPHLQDTRSKKG